MCVLKRMCIHLFCLWGFMPNRDPATGRFTSGGGSVSGGSGGGFNLGNAYGAVIIDVSGVGSAMQQAQKSIASGLSGVGQQIGSTLQDVGSGMEEIGQSVAGIGLKIGALVAPLALFGKKALGQFTDFNEAMTNVQAVTGASADEIKNLSDQILTIGKNSRSGPQAVAEAFYDIAGGVADASVRMPTLIAAVHAAEAGNADLGTTTKALISIMNGYGFSADKAGFASDVLTQTVAKGVGTMNDFATALPQVSGLANNLGINFQDLGAMMAYLTTKGVSANEASTQLSGMMISLINPTKEMSDALQKIGFSSGKAAIAQLGLAGTFAKLKASGVDVTQLGGRVEALRGIVSLTGTDAKGFLDNFSLGLQGLTDATQKIQNASPAAQLDFFNSSMSTLSITIGQSLAPALTSLLGKILPIIDSVLAWVRANPELVGQIGMIVAGLVAAVPVMVGVGAVISTVGSIIGGIGAVILLVTSPIGLVIGALAALAAAYFTNFGGVRDFIDGQVRPVLERVFNWLATVWETTIKPGIGALYTWFVEDALPKVKAFVEGDFKNALDKVFGWLGSVWNDTIAPGLDGMYKWFVSGGLSEIITAVQNFGTESGKIPGKIQEWVDKNQDLIKRLQDVGITIAIMIGAYALYSIGAFAAAAASAAVAGGVGMITGAIGLLLGPVGLAFIAIMALVTAYHALRDAADEASKAATNVAPSLATAIQGKNVTLQQTKDALYKATVDEYTAQGLPPALADARARLVWGSGIINMDQKAQDAYDKAQAINAGRAGTGVVPIPGVGGGSGAKRDNGGLGIAGMQYQIGPSQLRNEVYIPGASGQFVNDFVDLMKSVAAGVSGSNNQGGDTINVMMPAAALANPAAAQANGEIFGRAVADEMRARGIKSIK